MNWSEMDTAQKRRAVEWLRSERIPARRAADFIPGATQYAVQGVIRRANEEAAEARNKAEQPKVLSRAEKVARLKAQAEMLRGYRQVSDEGLGRAAVASVCLHLLARLAEHHQGPPPDVIERPHERRPFRSEVAA